MKLIRKFAGALLLCAALTAAGQIPSPEVAAIVARSQEALDRNDEFRWRGSTCIRNTIARPWVC